MKGWKKIFHDNGNKQKKAGVAILISNKTDFKTMAITRDREGHYIILIGLVQPRRYNSGKHICIQYRITYIYKKTLGGH